MFITSIWYYFSSLFKAHSSKFIAAETTAMKSNCTFTGWGEEESGWCLVSKTYKLEREILLGILLEHLNCLLEKILIETCYLQPNF